MFLTQLDYPAYLLFAITSDDDLWNLAIETGIRSPSKGTKLIGINTFSWQELFQVV
jgi:hypothetical protein